jgi:hypothetical protein
MKGASCSGKCDSKGGGMPAIDNVRWVYFPYCIEKQNDGTWLVLNRRYKPIGFNTTEFIDYQAYPVSMRIRGLGPATLKKLSWEDKAPGNRVYLYNDGCVPTKSPKAMSSYLKKLKILMKLKSVLTRKMTNIFIEP